MSHEFDSTLNRVIDLRADDWAAFLAARAGVPPGPSTPVDTRLSVAAQADKAFRIDGPQPVLVHLELESWSHLGVPATLKWYNDVLTHTHRLPVYSVLLLLRRKAVASDQTGVHEVRGIGGRLIHQFHYTVVRVWEESVDGLLAGGPGLAPLALLTDEANADLEGTLGRMEQLSHPQFREGAEKEAVPSARWNGYKGCCHSTPDPHPAEEPPCRRLPSSAGSSP